MEGREQGTDGGSGHVRYRERERESHSLSVGLVGRSEKGGKEGLVSGGGGE
jgi:hypothetical protein